MSPAARPTASRDRLPLLDAVRGMAVVGILHANLMSFFGADMLEAGARRALPLSATGGAVLFAIDWLVEGKFYSIFSMLLGAGFALQATVAARERRAGFAGFFRRRMLVLLAIGAVHMFGVWSGDILMLYGVMGLLLPWLWRWPARARLTLMALLFAVPLMTHGLVLATAGRADPRPPFAAAGAALRERWGIAGQPTLEVFARGTSAQYYAWNTANAVVRPGTYLQSGRPAKVLALFLLGAWLATTVLPSLHALRAVLWRTVAIGGGIGLAGSFVYASIKAATRSTFLFSGTGLLQTAAYTLGTTPWHSPTSPPRRWPGSTRSGSACWRGSCRWGGWRSPCTSASRWCSCCSSRATARGLPDGCHSCGCRWSRRRSSCSSSRCAAGGSRLMHRGRWNGSGAA